VSNENNMVDQWCQPITTLELDAFILDKPIAIKL